MGRFSLLVFLLVGTTVASAGELQPKAAAFLRELGIDLRSEEIASIIDDQAGLTPDGRPFTLDALATSRSENGVRYFIATRIFIKKYQQNTKTPFPPNDVYQIRYLKPAEVQFIRTALAGKLQPKAVAFLQEIGIDPRSEQITTIIDDQVGLSREGYPFSLDSLAALRSEDSVRQFVATRNFIRKYQKNTKTPFPPSNVYQGRYLKPDEVQFVIKEQKASGANKF
jgi:hypothetical protein